MSRIGNDPIKIPEGVNVDIQEESITVKGKLGELTQSYDQVSFLIKDSMITVSRSSNLKENRAKHGLYRSLLNNMVIGVSKGFVKELELVGVGYRANNQGQKLELSLGFSHNVVFEIPIEVKVETITEKGSNPIIKMTSFDKELLGNVVSKIRSLRKPEPYKGKGIKFVGEEIRRKAGKSA
jgi:large subunit ribosomal protein L6